MNIEPPHGVEHQYNYGYSCILLQILNVGHYLRGLLVILLLIKVIRFENNNNNDGNIIRTF